MKFEIKQIKRKGISSWNEKKVSKKKEYIQPFFQKLSP